MSPVDDANDGVADKPPVSSLTPTPSHPHPGRITMPAPELSSWAANANIAALRASDATNGAYSPSVLASGASSPAPPAADPGTPRGSTSRRPSRGASASTKVSASIKRMFGSGANTPAPAPTPPLATRSQSTETTQDSLLSNNKQQPPVTPDSESETTSDRFRSNPPSRAQSFSSEVRPRVSRPPSVSGQSDAHKFNLKDLLASTPKPAVSRKSSTGGSRKSDGGSEYGGKSVTSVASNGQLKHYGICERVAIGKGATSIVKLAHKWDRTEEKLYAVKEFRKRRKNESEKEYVKKLTSEFCISSALHHTNIVETVDLVKDENQHWCEVMEYCPGGDLYAAIKRGGMSPSEVECCFKQVLQGVEYLHSQGVAHRDIKPENLFFNQYGHLKIGDYGASTVYRLPWEKNIHMSTGLCGSEPYIAPEQFIHGQAYDARLVDIWACGIVYYCLHFQELPWRVAKPDDPLFQAYVTACNAKPAVPAGSNSPAPAQAPLPSTISNLSPRACRPLLRKMLDPNPKLRAQIEEIMKDPWLASVEVCTDTSKKPNHVHAHAQSRAAQTS